eukprot:6054746-Prymnesium_polylepis.1
MHKVRRQAHLHVRHDRREARLERLQDVGWMLAVVQGRPEARRHAASRRRSRRMLGSACRPAGDGDASAYTRRGS